MNHVGSFLTKVHELPEITDQVLKSVDGHYEDLSKYLRRNGYFPRYG